jgi:hypothetical protein
MPLLSPIALTEIHKVLKPQATKTVDSLESSAADGISGLMDLRGLSEEELLEHLNNIVIGGETSAVKVRALEIALKLKGHLQNRQDGQGNISVNIVIADSEFGGANPILVPRQI